jgi:protease I
MKLDPTHRWANRRNFHSSPGFGLCNAHGQTLTHIERYDAVVLPGGVQNSDTIRIDPDAQHLVKTGTSAGKPIAVICHGGWLLVSAGLVKGKTMTSYKTLKDDLVNAGANWVDKEVVKDGNLISSRQPDDIAAFNRELISALSA